MPPRARKATAQASASAGDGKADGTFEALLRSDTMRPDENGDVLDERSSGSAPQPAAPKKRKRQISHCPCCERHVQELKFPADTKRTGDKVQTSVGCLDCQEVYTMGNFSEVCKGCDTYDGFCNTIQADKKLKDAFRKAFDIKVKFNMHLEALPRAQVEDHEYISLKIRKFLRGYTPKEFTEKYGFAPGDLGIKIRDLDTVAGKKFKGVLVEDDEKPGVAYELVREVGMLKSKIPLSAGRKLVPNQEDLVLNKMVRTANSGNNSMWKHLRTCSLTDEDIMKKANKAKHARAQASQAETEEGASAKDAQEESEEEDEDGEASALEQAVSSPEEEGEVSGNRSAGHALARPVGGIRRLASSQNLLAGDSPGLGAEQSPPAKRGQQPLDVQSVASKRSRASLGADGEPRTSPTHYQAKTYEDHMETLSFFNALCKKPLGVQDPTSM